MKIGLSWGVALLILLPGWSSPVIAGKLLEVWPRQIQVEVLPPGSQQLGLSRGGLAATINLAIDTRQLGGQQWRLWLVPRSRPAETPVEIIRWEGRPPLISGTAVPDSRVLAGQGTVDGRVVRSTLVFWTQGDLPRAGFFPVQFEFILERLP